jgi:hypothetical protein
MKWVGSITHTRLPTPPPSQSIYMGKQAGRQARRRACAIKPGVQPIYPVGERGGEGGAAGAGGVGRGRLEGYGGGGGGRGCCGGCGPTTPVVVVVGAGGGSSQHQRQQQQQQGWSRQNEARWQRRRRQLSSPSLFNSGLAKSLAGLDSLQQRPCLDSQAAPACLSVCYYCKASNGLEEGRR